MLRSVAAVIGAALAIMVTVVAGTVLASAVLAGPDASVTAGYLAANLAVSFGAAVVGGWLVVRLARRRPMAHAGLLAAVLAIMTLPGLGNPAAGQPAWYPVAILFLGVTGVACGALAGGRVSARTEPGKQHV